MVRLPAFRLRVYCSFCGKSNEEVRHVIAGSGEAAICDGCVERCLRELREQGVEAGGNDGR